ncbi:MAG: hypothetical protein U1E02_02810, partial [Hydrogenophaga sp.]|nr:hypothetical protein [Hydrogenophaga sp.]
MLNWDDEDTPSATLPTAAPAAKPVATPHSPPSASQSGPALAVHAFYGTAATPPAHATATGTAATADALP